jgi:hypothetical protein
MLFININIYLNEKNGLASTKDAGQYRLVPTEFAERSQETLYKKLEKIFLITFKILVKTKNSTKKYGCKFCNLFLCLYPDHLKKKTIL